MIEIRIDTDLLQTHQHNILHSIVMMDVLRKAGVPVIGKIVFNGPERGCFVQWREQDMDGDQWVIQWFDDGEHLNPANYDQAFLLSRCKKTRNGLGVGFSWAEYRSHDEPAAFTYPRLIFHPESDCYFQVHEEADFQSVMNAGLCEDVTGMSDHEERFKQEQKAKEEW